MNSETEGLLNTGNNLENVNKPPRNWRYMLEPAILLFFLGWNLIDIIYQNQLLVSSCITVFKFNKTDCLQLPKPNKSADIKLIEDAIEPFVAKLLMWKIMLESIIPAALSLFIGPWGDKFGRKAVLNSTFSGLFISSTIIAVLSYMNQFTEVDPWYFVWAYLPFAMSGGFCSLFIGLICYTTDITDESNRSMKIGLMEGNIFLGALVGTLASSYVINLTSSTTVFGISAALILLATIYVIFVLKESVQISEAAANSSKLREFLSFKLVNEMITTCTKRRTNNERSTLWLAMTTLILSMFIMQGASNVSYLFVRDKFGWSTRENSFYDATGMFLLVMGTIFWIYLFKKVFKFSDISLAIIALTSSVVGSLVKAFASEPWHLYLGLGATFLAGIFSPMMRSVITKTVPQSEVGKLFSITTSFEAVSILGAAPLYTYIYTSTYKTFPGAFNLISAIVYGITLIIAIYINYLNPPLPIAEPVIYSPIINEEPDTNSSSVMYS